MNSEIIDSSEMVSITFSNIEKSMLEKNNKFYSAWKTVITKINRAGDENFGQKLYEHSSIVDVKNGVLLIETDHPGWSQMMQFYTKFILKGLKMYVPETRIEGIVFRTKGSNATLVNINYEEEFKKENEKEKRKLDEDEKILKKYEKFENGNNEKNELPENLVSIFDSMKKSMLTKNKNN